MIGNKNTRIIPGGPIERESANPQIKYVNWTHPPWDPKIRSSSFKCTLCVAIYV